MAKKRGRRRVNKSERIREYLDQENPAATPSEIVEAMRGKGVKVNKSLAANVKYSSAKRGSRGGRKKIAARRGTRAASAVRRTGRRGTAAALSAGDLFEAKKLVDQLGGIDEARRAIDALEQLR